MKRKYLLLVFILTVLSLHVNAQLQIDAGEDRIICVGGIINENEILYLGGNPTITGEKEPYTYTWSGKRKLLPSSKYVIYASDILNDTTLRNPTFEREKLLSGEFTFYLKVEDSDQLVAYDSVKIQSSSFVAYLESARSVQIQKGDSVQLFGPGYIDGDFHPLQFYISPSDGLSDSSDLYGWVKPLKTTRYSINAINRVGCVSNPAPYLDVSVSSDSKEFAPIGAKWHYTEPYLKESNFILMESVGDTTINGLNCRILKISRNGSEFISNEYIAQSGDAIRYYNHNTNEFHTLYDFSARIGDTIQVHSQSTKTTPGFLAPKRILDDGVLPNFAYRIQAIDSIEISGVWHKRQEVSFLTSNDLWGFSNGTGSSYLVEGIGSLTYFFGKRNFIVPEESVALLRCYDNQSIAFKNPLWSSSCTLVDFVEDMSVAKSFCVYPNPTSDVLHIELDNGSNLSVEVFDHLGRIRIAKEFNQSMQLNIEHLQDGLYTLRIKSEEMNSTYKIVKK